MEKLVPIEEESLVMAPIGDSKSEKKVIFLKRHSRTSSESSCSGDEQQADPILPAKVEKTEDAPPSRRVSGRCLCKLSIVLYLLACVVVSTLYVIFYGNKQQLFGEEAWIPGKVGILARKKNVSLIFRYIPAYKDACLQL